LGPIDLGQAGRPHPARGDQRLDLLAVDLRPHALRASRREALHEPVVVDALRAPVDPAEAQRHVDGAGPVERRDASVLLGHPDEHLVGVGAVGLQPGLELAGGREELHVHGGESTRTRVSRFARRRPRRNATTSVRYDRHVLRKDAKIELLKNVPLFSHCNKKQLASIASLADLISVPAGTQLITEGKPGLEFMVIVEGSGEVRRKGRKIDTLAPGDFIGEMALITGGPRNATVRTTTDTSLLA